MPPFNSVPERRRRLLLRQRPSGGAFPLFALLASLVPTVLRHIPKVVSLVKGAFKGAKAVKQGVKAAKAVKKGVKAVKAIKKMKSLAEVGGEVAIDAANSRSSRSSGGRPPPPRPRAAKSARGTRPRRRQRRSVFTGKKVGEWKRWTQSRAVRIYPRTRPPSRGKPFKKAVGAPKAAPARPSLPRS